MPTRGVFRFFVIPELNTLTKQNLNHQRIKKVSTTDKRFLRFSVDRQYYQFKDMCPKLGEESLNFFKIAPQKKTHQKNPENNCALFSSFITKKTPHPNHKCSRRYSPVMMYSDANIFRHYLAAIFRFGRDGNFHTRQYLFISLYQT